jgi:hypothetical protein
LLVIGAAACKRTPPPVPRPQLGAVSVRDLTPAEAAPARLDLPGLERDLRARLQATGLFAPGSTGLGDAGAGDDAQPTTRVRAELGIEGAEVGEKGVARAEVRLRLDTRPSEAPGAIEQELQGQGERSYAVPRGGTRRSAAESTALYGGLVARVMGDLVDGFAARRKLADGPPEAVHAAIAADGGALREEAIRVAGQRQLRQEVPTLLKLLSDDDEPTRDAALGALIAMRERRAVTELTRTRSLRDRREMQKIIEAIAIIGGPEADDYLAFVAQSHDDDEIRAQAAAARARLQRADGGPLGP